MPNVNFAAKADPYRGYRTPVAPNASTDSWIRNYIPKITTRPYPKITYPRPRSERAAFLHTQWDKWIAGYAWNPRIGVKDGHWPYRVYLTGSPPSGTTYANVIEDDNGTTSRHLRLYATPRGLSAETMAVSPAYACAMACLQAQRFDTLPTDASNVRSMAAFAKMRWNGGGKASVGDYELAYRERVA